MILFGWTLYGLLTSSVLFFLFPNTLLGGVTLSLVFALFFVLGGADQLISRYFKPENKII